MNLADSGDTIPLNDVVEIDQIEETVIPGFLDAVTDEDGDVHAAPMRMAVKSIVWYPKPEFDEAGYDVPRTLAAFAIFQFLWVW